MKYVGAAAGSAHSISMLFLPEVQLADALYLVADLFQAAYVAVRHGGGHGVVDGSGDFPAFFDQGLQFPIGEGGVRNIDQPHRLNLGVFMVACQHSSAHLGEGEPLFQGFPADPGGFPALDGGDAGHKALGVHMVAHEVNFFDGLVQCAALVREPIFDGCHRQPGIGAV